MNHFERAQSFYDPNDFAFRKPLEADWRAICNEYLAARDQLVDWGERKLYDEGWQVFALYRFPHGEPIPEAIARCPNTAAMVARWFPQHGAAGFSVMHPGTEIRPHEGYQGDFLRCHLGLVVPEGDCGIEVDGESRAWEAGRVMVFDDRLLHRAWNRTTEERAILLIDFVPE